MSTTAIGVYPEAVLPRGIRSRFVRGVNGLTMHVLEAGFETGGRPCVLLLHGFPELAYSWRKVMLPIAARRVSRDRPRPAGLRPHHGLGRRLRRRRSARSACSTWSGMLWRWSRRSATARSRRVVGHDFGSPVAAWCALVRPDVFRSVVLMSAPFAGPPALPFDTADAAPQGARQRPAAADIHAELAALARPRKHYQWYYSTREADDNMRNCPQGVHAFLRAYYHYKSADWKRNQAVPAGGVDRRRAGETADLLHHGPGPGDGRDRGAGDAVRVRDRRVPRGCPTTSCACTAPSTAGTGFQGGLQWYRCRTSGRFTRRAASSSPAARSTCRPASSPARATGAPTSGPVTSSGCRAVPAPACSAVTSSTAPGTGCSRSRKSQ